MAQYDVFENPNRSARATFPYIVVVQSEVSANNRTTIVAPITAKTKAAPEDRALLAVEINGEPFVVVMHGLAAMPLSARAKPMAQIPEIRDLLPRAIDYLFLGM